MIATEAVYHSICLSKYYNKERANNKGPERNEDSILKGIALAEVIAYMKEQRADNKKCTFRLADLTKMYQNVLEQLGIETDIRIHSTDQISRQRRQEEMPLLLIRKI